MGRPTTGGFYPLHAPENAHSQLHLDGAGTLPALSPSSPSSSISDISPFVGFEFNPDPSPMGITTPFSTPYLFDNVPLPASGVVAGPARGAPPQLDFDPMPSSSLPSASLPSPALDFSSLYTYFSGPSPDTADAAPAAKAKSLEGWVDVDVSTLNVSTSNPDLAVYPFDIAPSALTNPTISAANARAFDASLESPLQDAFPTFFSSPMFSPDVALGDVASSRASLFPESVAPSATVIRPNPPPPTRPVDTAKSATASASSKRKRKLDGFKNVPLLPLDAPVQPRTYLTPSATSRKDAVAAAAHPDPVAAEAAESPAPAAKRARSTTVTSDSTPTTMTPLESKRDKNTKAARRSRLKKKATLNDLVAENDAVLEENQRLLARVALLEGIMTTLGFTPPPL